MSQQYIHLGSDEDRTERLKNLQEDDKLYTVEFKSDNGEPSLDIKEFLFKSYIEKADKTVHIEGLEDPDDEHAIMAELKRPNFNKVQVKTDISEGFFFSEKEAAVSMVESLKWMYESARQELSDKFGIDIDS